MIEKKRWLWNKFIVKSWYNIWKVSDWMKTIYLVRHSAPFVEIENYINNDNILWNEFNKNMILSPLGEENAKKLLM